MSNFDQYDNIVNSAAVFYPNDIFSFYANLDELETDGNFANWRLGIYNDDFTLAFDDVGVLNQDFISGYGYRFWSTFQVPNTLIAGCYYLLIVDNNSMVQYASNLIKGFQLRDYTVSLRYRNDKNILNYNYEDLPDFYNRFRIQLKIRQPISDIRQTGYDLVQGSFAAVRSITGIQKEFITLWYNENDHEAFNAASIHLEFEFVENGQWRLYRRDQTDYNIDWQDNYPLAEGNIRLQRVETYKSSKLI